MKHNWIKYSDFVLNHNINVMSLHVSKAKGFSPPEAFKRVKGSAYIDEMFFIRRKDFRKKVWLLNHENFYFLNKQLCNYDIARLLYILDGSITMDSWSTWMNNSLFKNMEDTSILVWQTTKMHWLFNRFTTWIIRYMFRKTNVKPINGNMEDIWDV